MDKIRQFPARNPFYKRLIEYFIARLSGKKDVEPLSLSNNEKEAEILSKFENILTFEEEAKEKQEKQEKEDKEA